MNTEHPEAAEACSDFLRDDKDDAEAFKRRQTPQDIGDAIGSAIGWSVVALLCFMALVHLAHVFGIGPGVARVAGWVAGFFR